MMRAAFVSPDLAEKAISASHAAGKIKTHERRKLFSFAAVDVFRFKKFAATEVRTKMLKPKPIPAQSSVGNSPSVKKPSSKYFCAATKKCGIKRGACSFHQCANGKTGGAKLL